MVEQDLRPGRALGIVPNLRDVGGYRTDDGGVVRTGMVYRSTKLDQLRGDASEAFARLGIRTVYDLRSAAERRSAPDLLPEGTRLVPLDVFADVPGEAPTKLISVLEDVPEAERMLGGGRLEAHFRHAYRDFVSLPSAQRAYARLFTDLATPDQHPALFHCTTGKDRTGWAAAVLLLFLGVDEDDVMADFLLSSEYVLPSYQPVIDAFAAAGGDPAIPTAVLGVRPEYLDYALAEMRQRYETVEGYLAEGLGLDSDVRQRLRDVFVRHD
ncbi:MAG TPA: tyrosine-protein phosphatase [Actinomycetes bacterium]|nr:tyrosine-protein phosphatase [Actinomycetes bacterium]